MVIQENKKLFKSDIKALLNAIFTQHSERLQTQVVQRFKKIHKSERIIASFQPKIRLHVEKENFIIKTAQSSEELRKALELRYEVFYQELQNRKNRQELDVDKFDLICDHLIIQEKETGNYIGTYRVNSSVFSDSFYSANEFEIENIRKLPGNKLELGRACIDKEHRNGITISLLWAGISEYMKASNTRYLFGCSSVMTTDLFQIASAYQFLKENNFSSEEVRVKPTKKYRIKNLDSYADFLRNVEASYNPKNARKLIPSLLKSYIKTGAVVCGEPALDQDFQCIDFFTLLDVRNMKESVMKKFAVC
jgi:putative hemolysin